MTSSAAKEKDPNEIVCRRERATGSNISRKICRTVAEMKAREEEDQAMMRQMRATRSGSENDTQGIRPGN